MNKKELIKHCLISDDALETYPFGQDKYKDTVVMRHKCNNKWFALIFYLEEKLYINLKCEPETAALLRVQYSAITPAWHMNKKHWVKVDVNEIASDVLNELIKISFNITDKKRRK